MINKYKILNKDTLVMVHPEPYWSQARKSTFSPEQRQSEGKVEKGGEMVQGRGQGRREIGRASCRERV